MTRSRRHRRAFAAGIWLLAVGVAPLAAQWMAVGGFVENLWVFRFAAPFVGDAMMATGLLGLGLLFAIVCAVAFLVLRRSWGWGAVAIAWACGWSAACDRLLQAATHIDTALQEAGVVPPSRTPGFGVWLTADLSLALATSAALTAGLLGAATRSRPVLLTSLAAAALPMTVWFWPEGAWTWIATAWFALVGGVLLRWAARLPAAAQSAQCPSCGYDLTGNTTGICPECGTAATS